MGLENCAMQEAESAEFQISRRGVDMAERLMEHFGEEARQKEGREGIYHSLFFLHKAIILGAINHGNYADYQALLNGKIPFHVEKGRWMRREYYFGGKKGYRTNIRVFSSPKKAFDPVSVDGVKD